MSVTFEQRKIPKLHPDALSAVGICSCGFSLAGSTVDGVKQAMETMETCPLCRQPFFLPADEFDAIGDRMEDKMKGSRDDWEKKGYQR
jgi:hypothetical protein